MKKLRKLKNISISTRISILLGIIILLTMGLFSIFSLVKQKADAIATISKNTEQLSQTIEKILRFSMLKNRRDEIFLAVKSIAGTEEIKSARILNHQGLIIYTSRQSELNQDISQNNPLCKSCHNGKDDRSKINIKNFNHYRINEQKEIIYYSLPIFNETECSNGACHAGNNQQINMNDRQTGQTGVEPSVHSPIQVILGFIEIEVSIKQVISDLKETRLQLIILTLIFALMASVIAYFSIKYIIGKPVQNLVEGTKRVAQGDFEHPIPPGKAELGILADSFNKMQNQLLRTQTQLIESEKLASVGKLANEIANEINNPLTGIIIYSESLLEAADNSKDDYNIIRQEALKIRESVRNILSLTRYEKPDFKLIDIGSVIKQAVSVVKRFSNFRNIKIIMEIGETLPEIPADAALMEQVFLNFLLISSESMLTGGILDISASYKDERNEIEINFHDTGKPIPEATLRNITDDTSNLKNFEKTGISLVVCKDIIRMHRGKLNINSGNSGTTTTIIIPV
jgi:two-component system NtrC family sensor kinase